MFVHPLSVVADTNQYDMSAAKHSHSSSHVRTGKGRRGGVRRADDVSGDIVSRALKFVIV